MKLAQFLFKPKWQDKNAEVRRQAVANDSDAQLSAALPEIARSDADAGVRIVALKRLNDYESWRERSTGDSDGDVRRQARNAYIAMLCAKDARVPDLARRIAELDTLSQEEMEKVATQAADRDLRSGALARVNRPALLADRAITDPDAALRGAALDRIVDVVLLERIAERARKTDKIISRRARERVAVQRIGSGDSAAIAIKARLLCERMDALIRIDRASDQSMHDAIENEWQTLGNDVPVELQSRFRGAEALVRQMRTNAQNPQVSSAPMTVVDDSDTNEKSSPATIASIAPSLSAVDVADARPALLSVELLASQARFDAALASAAADSQREREQRRVYLREIEDLSTQYSNLLETGDVAAAHALHDRLLQVNSLSGALPAPLEARLAPLHVKYAELKRWQSWANQQRRQSICEAIEHAAQANLHPDALATRVREAREEWQKLDASEGLGGSDAGLTRRFHALCHQTLKPAKTYFNKRDELRRSHSEAIESLLKEASELPEEISDWKAVGALRLKLGESLRALDAVDPRERTRLGKRIKEAIGFVAPRIDTHIEAIEKAKLRLIERATALSAQTDGRSITRDARDLQQQWTALGNGKRGVDQRQWTLFRAAVDAAFGKLDAARETRDAQSSAARALSESLVAEIENLQGAATTASDAMKLSLRDVDSRWQNQRCSDRGLEQRYRKAHDTITESLKAAVRRKHLSRYTAALDKYTLLRSIETGEQSAETVAAQWSGIGLDATDFSALLDTRLEQFLVDPSTTHHDAERARDRVVEFEFIAGVETPGVDRQRRMNYQVQRLATRMRERVAVTPETELAQALAGWFSQSSQAVDIEARFARAAHAAINALP